jgi:hypothetical protein
MWLVLCDTDDVSALWAYQGLKARGLVPLELVSAETLSYGLHWEHRLSGEQASVEIQLADGRQICGEQINGVLNRLLTIPTLHWRNASAIDRDYVIQELTAFYLSWLHALRCPMLNRPTPQGLSGQWRQESEWVWSAAQAGLPTPVYRQTSFDQIDPMRGDRRLVQSSEAVKTVIVVDGCPVGAAAPAEVLDGCCRLAERSGTDLLGIEFVSGSAGDWTFVGATPMPDLRLGGRALLDALALALEGG